MTIRYLWNKDKNRDVLALRGVDFPMVIQAISQGDLLADIEHPAEERKHQRIFIVKMKGDVYAVPYVKDGGVNFLKTIFPSRKYRYIYGGHDGQG